MRTYANVCQDCGTTVAAMSVAEPGTSLCFGCATAQNTGDGWRWRADRGGWTHCDDRAEYDDDGATCRKCYRFMSHDDAAARMIE